MNFHSLWIGPFTIEQNLGHNSFKLNHLDGSVRKNGNNTKSIKL